MCKKPKADNNKGQVQQQRTMSHIDVLLTSERGRDTNVAGSDYFTVFYVFVLFVSIDMLVVIQIYG